MSYWLQPSEIYEYPAVEYIPISIENLILAQVPAVETAGVTLAELKAPEHCHDILARLKLALPGGRSPDFKENLVLLCLNAEVEQCHYRAYQTLLVGRVRPGACHLFQITRRYFYKESFQAVLYDQKAKPLAVIKISLRQASGR